MKKFLIGAALAGAMVLGGAFAKSTVEACTYAGTYSSWNNPDGSISVVVLCAEGGFEVWKFQ